MHMTSSRPRAMRSATIRRALAALLSVTGSAALPAPDRSGTPAEAFSINIMATNRTPHDATITRVESVDATGRVTRWSFGATNPTVQAQASNVAVGIAAPARDVTAAELEGIMATVRASTFRITVRSNGATQVLSLPGRGVTRAASRTSFPEIVFTLR